MTAQTHRDLSVTPADLRKACDTLSLAFERSDELPATTTLLGQQRAIDAIRFGIQMANDGYNVVVLGHPGSHRHGLVDELVGQEAAQKRPPPDWCYVNNFADSERPQALHFEAGEGGIFRQAMHRLIEEMKLAIPAAFEGDDYRSQLRAIEEKTEEEVAEQWRSLEELASKHDIHVLQTPTGYVLAPVEDGKVLDDKEFEKLPEDRQREIEQSMQELTQELQNRIQMMPKLRKRHRERVKALDRQVMEHSVSTLLLELKTHYETMPHVLSYLNAVEGDIIENSQNFRQTETPSLPFLSADHAEVLRRYEVNLVVDNKQLGQAPVVYEPNPNYPNLIGRVEHRAEMGALVTDFRMIRAGALHQANGGFLILDLHRLFARPFSWDGLKQALLAKRLRIESPGEAYGWVSTTTLKPEPIPLDVKIVLIGERWLYYLLCLYDHEFSGLFKVAADFNDDISRDPQTVDDYARLIAQHVTEKDLLPFTRAAVQRVIEQQARHADDGEKLSMDMRALDDLLLQSDHWARQRGGGNVDMEDVTTATEKHRRRFDRLQTRILDAITRDTLLIDTSGACIGQVNGLSIIDLGQFRYGHPVRITATTRIGTGDVVDIEREVELGGKIHSKGMLILSSGLTSRFAPEVPLSLHGSVVFEQSYGGVEGDSASVAEMCALLSSISRVPLKQNIAVTGSVNQLGRVQAVGGINEKIEGFFDLCRERGLDGSHAVIIPRNNVKHLMLRDDVVAAARDGKFCIYSVEHVDEALSLLTGMEAGARGEDGAFPEGSVNARVEAQLVRYAKLRKAYAEPEKKDDLDGDEK
jgi:lon-related putative ATP-dependent protease